MELKLPSIFNKKKKEKVYNQDVIAPVEDDGFAVINSGGIFVTQYYDEDIKGNKENIEKWRGMMKLPDVSAAMSEILTDSIVVEDNKETVRIDFLEDVELSEAIKEKLSDEFRIILKLMNFHKSPDDIYEEWLRDGVQYYHKIFDDKSANDGIQKLVKIDPLKIKPVREVTKKKNSEGIDIISAVEEYFLVDNDTTLGQTTKIKIPKAAIAYVNSGIVEDGQIMSILEAAVKPSNQLNDLEDSTVIYAVARAPQKRVFYVDVGNLPKTKAEQYMAGLIAKFKNKMIYDSKAGQIKDSKHIAAMVEDYWLPRKSGSRGTEISTIDGGGSFDNLDEMMYFRKKVYKSLNIPTTRLDPETSFTMGRDGDITRDEVKFSRYISKSRQKYSALFLNLLETQVILKGILTAEEWTDLEPDIKFQFLDSTHFKELMDLEMYSMRFDALQGAEMYTDKYISHDFVRTVLLRQTDEQMKEEDKKIAEEKSKEQYKNPDEDM